MNYDLFIRAQLTTHGGDLNRRLFTTTGGRSPFTPRCNSSKECGEFVIVIYIYAKTTPLHRFVYPPQSLIMAAQTVMVILTSIDRRD